MSLFYQGSDYKTVKSKNNMLNDLPRLFFSLVLGSAKVPHRTLPLFFMNVVCRAQKLASSVVGRLRKYLRLFATTCQKYQTQKLPY